MKWNFSSPDPSNNYVFSLTAESASTSTFVIPVKQGASQVAISSLTPCENYQLTMVANKNSVLTRVKTEFTIPANAPSPVIELKIVAKNSRRIDVVAIDPTVKSICGDYRYYFNLIDSKTSIGVFSGMSLRPYISTDSLTAGSTYEIQVYSVELNSRQRSNIVKQSYTNAATETSSFMAPDYFYVTNITTSSAIFSWAPVTRSTAYLLTYWSGEVEPQKISLGNVANKGIHDLQSCTYYQATVQSLPEVTIGATGEDLSGNQAKYLILQTLARAYTKPIEYQLEHLDSTNAIFAFKLDEKAFDSCGDYVIQLVLSSDSNQKRSFSIKYKSKRGGVVSALLILILT
ncbi:hypothetical protein Ciccas_012010 [Cichlidogyrus casuarinus]|uniref:Fibronectin type-III domain-containing protein n=1 Tax=Cichlidogyrus casuarinus TaxID=1844966 RepID=A0ABD2PPL2_9PLAT